MFERSAGPPVFGLFFLATVVGGVGWAATAETDPVIEAAPSMVAKAPPAGAAQSRMVEFNRRTMQQ